MPFLLRRTKDEVLSDLPEKIIQDRYCDLSPLQLKLYEQFSSSNAKEEISTIVKAQESDDSAAVTTPKATTTHVFQVPLVEDLTKCLIFYYLILEKRVCFYIPYVAFVGCNKDRT